MTETANDQELRVIGVGASAGGLEALQALLEPASKDYPAAIVVIQHLAPDHATMTAELLGRHTKLRVVKVTEDTLMRPNVVYVIEPKTLLTLHEDTLIVEPRDDAMRLHRPIDRFFQSLAEERGVNAYGVVLSGTGSDGTDGARAIKEAGGFMVAQSPDTARFDGMPRSVINARCHDLCLPPMDILERILQLSVQTPEDLAKGTVTLDNVLRVLAEQEDIDLTNYRAPTVRRRVERRIALAQLKTVREYVGLLRSSPAERAALVSDLFIGVTRFFRDPEAYSLLQEKLQEFAQGEEPFRCWICGCSTGEEAYSVGMILWQLFMDRGSKRDFKIFATDVSDAAIRHASRGLFTADAMRDVPADKQARFFRRNDDGHFVCDGELRNRIVFSQHDALRDPPFSKLDLVVCRNMLIYLQPDAQRQLLGGFSFSLREGAILWLGPSESGAEKTEEFAPLDTRWRIFRNHSPRRGPRLDWKMRAPAPPSVPRLLTDVPVPGRRGDIDWRRLHDDLAQGFLPSHFILNDQFRVLFQHGSLARDLIRFPEGEATTDLRALLPISLRPAIESLVVQAIRGKETELRDVSAPEFEQTLNLRCRAVGGGSGIVALFVQRQRPVGAITEEPVTATVLNLRDIEADLQKRVESLEHDILITRESLQNTVEELESSNEELQATNEELLASNEELQSVNEELQSVNEELHTVNMEHQQKIIELGTLNADLDALLATVDHGVLFLDSELKVRRFNPKVQDFVAVMNSDIGRPFSHFSHQLTGFPLLDICARCLREKEPIEELVDVPGSKTIALVRLRPLPTRGEHDGIVISITDITNIERLREMNTTIRSALDTVSLPLGLLRSDGMFDYANQALANLAGRDARYVAETDAADLIEPGHQEVWHQATAQVLRGQPWEGYLQLARPDQARISELVRLSPIVSRGNEVGGMVRLTLMHTPLGDVDESSVSPSHGFLTISGRSASERHVLALCIRDLALGGETRERALRVIDASDRQPLARALAACDDLVDHPQPDSEVRTMEFNARLADAQIYRARAKFSFEGGAVHGALVGVTWTSQADDENS